MQTITALSKKPWFLGSLVVIFIVIVLWNIPIEKRKYGLSQSSLVTDYTGLLPERVERVVKAENRTELQKIVKQANKNGQQISVAGLHTHKEAIRITKIVSFLICGHSTGY
ncbi:hypothetical protein [Metabacillus fastidiosus]|uniref:hypothetical protein n=1 Tax=Metabacillus fastidiosus TaxID=1458 RepID=UPI002DBD218C|nr:hypothetical protein [Metabacillus fastidiosus]MEC2076353.1 hypothetical protein [Metabacillus fastidiosus]